MTANRGEPRIAAWSWSSNDPGREDVSAVLDGRVDLRARLTPETQAGALPIIAICGIFFLVWAALRPSITIRRRPSVSQQIAGERFIP
jgi:hypothetical protein